MEPRREKVQGASSSEEDGLLVEEEPFPAAEKEAVVAVLWEKG